MKNCRYVLPNRRRQTGVTLFMVLVIMLLSLTAVLGAFRVANLNESLLGNTSDYNLTYAAAEALIRDAEIDIKGRRPPYTVKQADGSLGFPCRPNPPNDLITNTDEVGFEGSCRNRLNGDPWFPQDAASDFDAVANIVTLNANRCVNSICMPLDTITHSNIESNLGVFAALGATYGQYTRNGLNAPGFMGNPVLIDNIANNRIARYWVEVFRYQKTIPVNGRPNLNFNLEPSADKSVIYRITAVAQGRKPGTRVVLKSFYVASPAVQGQ